jgi:D-3-phosphoglycerate dehydrogenase / 2-oxoglutarate reductase
MTNILLADKLHPTCINSLEQLPNVTVLNRPELTAETLLDNITNVDVLVVRSTKVTAEVLAKANSLGLIIRAGAGTNTIDVKAASTKGIYVTNCPGKNAAAVAELAVGLMLAIDRRIPDNVAALHQGRWNKKKFSKANGIKGRTLGIIGLGSIGREVIARCRPFGMKFIAWSRSLTPQQAEALGIDYAATPQAVAAAADIVSLHLALSKETRNLINADFLAQMKPGAVLINTSRGEVVDEAALKEALIAKRIFAGLDVFDNEPTGGEAEFTSEITLLENLYGTHHIGASTDQAESETGEEVVRIVKRFLSGGEIPNCVNLRRVSTAKSGVIVRHEDRVGVLAEVLAVLKTHGCNVQEMQNQIFDGAPAASAKIMLAAELPTQAIAALNQCPGVLHVAVVTTK